MERRNAHVIDISPSSVRRAVGLFAACALMLGAVAVGAVPVAAEVAGSQFQISSSNQDYLPAIAFDSMRDQYLVVWSDQADYYGGYVMTAQLLDASGNAVGGPIVVHDFGASEWAQPPSVVYNATADEFFVAWSEIMSGGSDGVYAQRIDASDGSLAGTTIGISGSTYSQSNLPRVAWNASNNEYLVVWVGSNSSVSSADQVYGRLVDGATGTPSGDDMLISATEAPAAAYWHVAVAHNTAQNEFLVAWTQEDGMSNTEIWGRRVPADGAVGETSNFQISDMPFGYPYGPKVAYDSDNDRYLVVFVNDSMDPWGAVEVFGQLVAADGSVVGSTFQISNRANEDIGMGVLAPRRDAGAIGPDVAYNPDTDRYLVVFSESATQWKQWDDSEIYGDYVTTAGTLAGTRDFQISDMGAWHDLRATAIRPAVAFNSTDGEFMTVWVGAGNIEPLTNHDYNIWGSRVSGSEPASAPTDTVAPQTAITVVNQYWKPISPNGSGQFEATVKAAVRAFDGVIGSGIAQIRCALDPELAPATFTDLPDEQCTLGNISEDGQYTIYAASIDNDGNIGAVVSQNVWIARPPSVAIDEPSDAYDYTTTPASYRLTATFSVADQNDAAANLTVECSLDSGTWEPCSIDGAGSGTHTFLNVAAGPHLVSVRATDPAGNTGTSSRAATVTADSSVPTIETLALDVPHGKDVPSGTVVVTYSASDPDNPASVLTYRCGLDSSIDLVTCDSTTTHTFTGVKGGNHTVYLQVTDPYGNASDVASATRRAPIGGGDGVVEETIGYDLTTVDPTWVRTTGYAVSTTVVLYPEPITEAGTITQFQMYSVAAAKGGAVTFDVWRPATTAGQYVLVSTTRAYKLSGQDGIVTFGLGKGVPVAAGDYIGVYGAAEGAPLHLQSGATPMPPGELYRGLTDVAHTVGAVTPFFTFPDNVPNLSATFMPVAP